MLYTLIYLCRKAVQFVCILLKKEEKKKKKKLNKIYLDQKHGNELKKSRIYF